VRRVASPEALLLAFMACGPPTTVPLAAPDLSDVEPLTEEAWVPPVDTTWHWQLTGTLSVPDNVDLVDLDLFDTPDPTLTSLHESGHALLCYFSAGSWEDWRDDADQFPTDALGKRLDGWPGERWLDVRHQGLRPIMEARLDLAAARGCDGVEPDNVDGYSNSTGFDLTNVDQLEYNVWLANAAHARGLAIALKNDTSQVVTLEPYFDLAVVEECHRYNECEAYLPFLEAGKPILEAEYVQRANKADARAAEVCPTANDLGLRTLILPWDLDGSLRVPCWE
jgi:hypothetical protein